MDLIKRNWLNIVFALITLIGLVLSIILLIQGPIVDLSLGEYTDGMYNSSLFMLIAQTMFFSAIFLFLVLKIFDALKNIKVYLILGIGLVTLVFVVLSITSALEYSNYAATQIQNGFTLAETLPSGVPIEGIGNITKEVFVNQLEVKRYALLTGTYAKFINLFIFAVLPIAYAVKKLVKQNKI